MSLLDDMTGRVFGRLTVTRELGGGKIECRCVCGSVKVYNKSNVKSGKTTSCGCTRRHPRPEIQKNIVGQKYGMLTVITELGYGRVRVHCDCGRSKVVSKSHLLTGDIVSCGCLQRDRLNLAKEPYMTDGTNIAIIASTRPTCRSKTGVRGVSWSESKGKFRASIRVSGITHELGLYSTLAEAAAARKRGEDKYARPIIEAWKKKEK